MAEPNKIRSEQMRTGEISLQLRTWAERIRNVQKKNYKLLISAADRLDEQEERIAIMSELPDPNEYDLTFPPGDDEIDYNDTLLILPDSNDIKG